MQDIITNKKDVIIAVRNIEVHSFIKETKESLDKTPTVAELVGDFIKEYLEDNVYPTYTSLLKELEKEFKNYFFHITCNPYNILEVSVNERKNWSSSVSIPIDRKFYRESILFDFTGLHLFIYTVKNEAKLEPEDREILTEDIFTIRTFEKDNYTIYVVYNKKDSDKFYHYVYEEWLLTLNCVEHNGITFRVK